MGIFHYLCHQKEGRCFRYRGKPMPLCARCLGFYISFIVGILAMTVLLLSLGEARTLDPWYVIGIFLLAQIPMFVDGGLQLKTGYESTNARRFATGIPSGLALGGALVWCLVNLVL